MLRQGNSFESNSGTTKQFVFNLLGTILRGVDSLKEERNLFWVGHNVFENYFEVTPNYKHLCHAPKKKTACFQQHL